MTTNRYALPLDDTSWTLDAPTDALFQWDYDTGRDRMLGLYEKGKEKQWNAQDRIDWSLDVDPADQAAAPDELIPIHGSPMWDELDREKKDEVRHHVLSWLNSQFLHGEQGALLCAAKIVDSVPDMDAKFYAATQVMDEARHVETYAKFLHEKVEMLYPINPELQTLLEQTLSDRRWDFTYLGMQVMIEGVALAAFSMQRDFTQHPLGQSIVAYVMQDEARHVAFGRMALKDAYEDLTEQERQERQEFIVEASYLLRDRFLLREVWENMGFDADECVKWVDQHQMMTEYRKALFSRVVPCVKDIGLLGGTVQEHYAKLGIMGFQDFDLDELSENDDRIAEELEVQLQRVAEGKDVTGEGRAADIARTMAAAKQA